MSATFRLFVPALQLIKTLSQRNKKAKKYIDMISCRITTDEYGRPKAIYANGFTFEGEFGKKHTPKRGIIKDPEGNIVFEGLLIDDIYQYFQKYLETGRRIVPNGVTL